MLRTIFITIYAFLFMNFSGTPGRLLWYVSSGEDVTILAGTTFTSEGLVLTPSSDLTFSAIELNLATSPTHASTYTLMSSVYEFSKVIPSYSGTIRIYYNEADLNGLAEDQLYIHIFNGYRWKSLSPSFRDGTNNYIELENVSGQPIMDLSLGAYIPPVITLNSSLSSFTYCQGSSSAADSFSVSGLNLTGPIGLKTPAGFESSLTKQNGYADSLTLNQSADSVAATTIYVRVKSNASGTITGNIQITSPGATTRTVSVSATGTVPVTPSVSLASSDPDNSICAGTRIYFTATPLQEGTPSYQWKLNDNNVGGDSANYVTDTLKNGDVVKVVMTSSLSCVTVQKDTSDAITTAVLNVPQMNVVPFKDSTICTGSTVKLVAASGNGLSFNGTTNVTIAHNPRYNFSKKMTFEAWFKTSSSAQQYLTTKNENSFYVGINVPGGANKLGFYLNNVTGSWLLTNREVNDGKWHHVAATYDGQYMRIYIDGSLSAYRAGTNSILTGTSAVEIGSRGNGYKFVGSLDEVRFWNTARLPNEIVTYMHKVVPYNSTGLVAVYHMDESSGATLLDGAGNADNNGTINGTLNRLIPSKAPLADSSFASYSWTTGDTASYISVSPASNTSYSATGTTPSGCTRTDDQTIYVSGSAVVPSVSITSNDADNIICSGTSVTFTANPVQGGTSPVYKWLKNGIQVGSNSNMYTLTTLANNDEVKVVITSMATCAQPDTAESNSIITQVNSYVTPSVSITSTDDDSTICSGTQVTFTATPTNGGSTPNYQWKLNNANVGTNSATYVTDTLKNQDVVKVVMTSNASCLNAATATSNAITTTVTSKVTPSVSILSSDADNTICSGAGVRFTAFPVNGGIPSYQWKLNGVNVGGDSAQYETVALQNSDTVRVVMTSSLSCVSSSTAQSNTIITTVHPNVTPAVTIVSGDEDNTICPGTSVTFTATPINGGTPSYQWKINSLNAGTNSATFTTTALTHGDTVRVVMTSSLSCISSSTVESNTIITVVNSNVTPAVTLTSSDEDRVICSGTSVTFTATPTNGGGSPSYQWKLNGNNTGTNSATFTTTALTNGDTVKVVMTSSLSCVTASSAESNTQSILVISSGGSNALWLGNTSNNWFTGSNWCGGSVPLGNTSVTIPAGVTKYPVLEDNVSVANLDMASGTTLSLNGKELTVTGTLSGTGRLVGSHTSSLVISGSGSIGTLYFATSTPGSSDALSSLTMNRSGQTLTLGNTLNVYDLITPTAGTLNTNGYLILKSNSSGTARIAAGSGNYITGEVTVERYIPATGRRYRLLTPTVNTSGSIRSNWMENGLNTAIGSNNDPYPGYGTQITGLSGNVNGFDVTSSNQASLYLATNGVNPSYTAVTNTSGPLNAKTGYFLFVRGDRSVNMTLSNTNVPPTPVQLPSSSTTLRTKGTLITGTVSSFTNAMSSTAGALNLVTNPYASPIAWASVQAASSNISEYYTLWDPKIGFRGGFIAVGIGGERSDTASKATTIIQPGQAFFVQATGAGTASVTIHESHKTSGDNIGVFAPTLLPTASLQASIYYTEGTGYRRMADGVLSNMDNSYNTGVDASDAIEIANWDENLAWNSGGKLLAIEKRALPVLTDTSRLYISNMKQMNYEMEVKASGFAAKGLQPMLIDRYGRSTTELKDGQSTLVPFSVTSAAASYASDRFIIVYTSTSALPIRILNFKAAQKDQTVTLEWLVDEDENISSYEVERSTDGSDFRPLLTQQASGLNRSSARYTNYDAAPISGNNYYRLKVIEQSGSMRYSQVVVVQLRQAMPLLALYPNPLKGTELTLQLKQWRAGSYLISINDVTGLEVYRKNVITPAGNSSLPINVKRMATGVYWLRIRGGEIDEVKKVVRE